MKFSTCCSADSGVGTPASGTGGTLPTSIRSSSVPATTISPRFLAAACVLVQQPHLFGRVTLATDLEGNARTSGGKVDLGAYQNLHLIFANGFDPP